jgi:uncharacterized protein (UPF0332 family)
MSTEYDDCLKKGKIKVFSRGKELAGSEIKAAQSDLERAQKTSVDNDFKWGTVQLYYAMFHTARALIYSKNLREHSHYCLIEAVRVLYVERGKISAACVEALKEAKTLREDADYYNRWSKEAYEKMHKKAQEFLEKAEEIVKGVK